MRVPGSRARAVSARRRGGPQQADVASNRQRMLEVLNSGQFAAPIIIFVNQKKTADMVAKDLSRAGVRISVLLPSAFGSRR